MNKIYWLLTVFISFNVVAQIDKKSQIVKSLKENIINSEKGERLKWMDSLANYYANDTDFESDSLNKITQKYAIQLDSIDMAAKQTIHLIYYQNIIKGDTETAKKIFEANQFLFKKIKSSQTKCKFLLEGANTYFYLRDYDKALSLYNMVEKLASKNKLEDTKAKAIQGKGSIYTEKGNFGAASLNLQNALKYFLKVKDTTLILDIRNSLSILYSKNEFFKEAKKERDAIIELSLKAKKYDLIPVYYFNYAGDYKKLNNQKARLESLKKAMEMNSKSKFKGYLEPFIFAGLATAYAENDSLQKAKLYFTKLKKIYDGKTESAYQSVFLEAQKNIAFAEKDHKNALFYGKKHVELSKKNKEYEEISFGEKFLSDVYTAMEDETNAFIHFKNYIHLKDSVENSNNLRVLSYYQTIYETEKRDLTIQSNQADIKLLNKQNELKNQYIIFGGIGFISFLGLLLLYHSMKNIRLREQQRQQFTTQLINTQELERSRVAKELHDSVGQKLLVLKNALKLKSQTEEDLEILLNSVVTEVREISHNLHPYQFEILGFVGAIEDLIENFQRTSKTFYSTEISIPKDIIPKEKEIIVFRIIQECLTNVEKHANATACQLVAKQNKDNIIFTITDNGKGFDTSITSFNTNGLGNISMKERAIQINGILKIDSKLGSGTTVNLTIQKS